MVKKVEFFKRCCVCEALIEEGQKYYDFDGDAVCDEQECVYDYIEVFKKACVDENYADYISREEGRRNDERDY